MQIGISLALGNAAADPLALWLQARSKAAWFKPGVGVTGSLTVSNWADQSGNGRDLAQATAGNQPINLPHTGTDYCWLPSISGNMPSTPAAAANQITGDIAIVVKVALDDFTPSASGAFVSRFSTANSRSYELRINTDGTLALGTTPGTDAAIVTATSSAAVGITDAATKWIAASRDVDDGSSQNVTKFWLSDDGFTWTQLGTTQTIAGATTIAAGIDAVYIGGRNLASTFLPAGKVYQAQIYSGIPPMLGGSGSASPVVNFQPSQFSETSTNGSTATMPTGEVWTLNSTGVYPATIVKSSQILFGGVDEYLKTAAFTLNQPISFYLVGKQVSHSNGKAITDGDGSAVMLLRQETPSPNLGLYAGSAVVATNTEMAVGAFAIATTVWSGAASLLQINAGTPTTGNPGTSAAGGLTLGRANPSDYANWIVKEWIIFPAADDAATMLKVLQALNARHHCF